MAPVESVARQIRDADPAVRVACAYLELSEPDLLTAAAQLVSQGVSRIRVLPLEDQWVALPKLNNRGSL